MLATIIKRLFFLSALLIAGLGVVLGFGDRAWAADWQIDRFDSQITIQSDGRVAVTETIDVDFAASPHHGIYRDLPVAYKGQEGQPEVFTEIELVQATQDGRPATTKTETNDAAIRFRLGDADTTLTGKHQYSLSYLVTGVLRGYAEYDELYWNVTGHDWDVPIQIVTASVTLPTGQITQLSCYQGPSGSTQSCQSSGLATTTANFASTTPFAPGDELTVAVAYPKELIPLLAVTRPSSLPDTTTLVLMAVSFLGILGYGSWRIWRSWHTTGRDITDGKKTIVPEYEAPAGLRPAEIGVLMDEQADTLDVSATIVDLAVRGYLTITEIPKAWRFGEQDYELTRKRPADDRLLSYERQLLGDLFADGATVRLSGLKNTFYQKLAKVKTELYADITAKAFFTGNPETIRNRAIYWGIGLLGVGLMVSAAGIKVPVLLGPGPAVVILGILRLITAYAMPAKTLLGSQLARQSAGFELFINTAEKYRARFAEHENLFTEILPYAIVFGATEKLAKAMKVMELEPPQPTWYAGTHHFNAAVFARDLDGFSRSLSSAMATAPSSSGSGGGGFSGGGFGGGGGGGW